MTTLARSVSVCMLLLSCHRQGGGLHVLQYTPTGAQGEPPKEVVVTFDRAMVADAQVGVETAAGPLVFEPPVAGRYRYVDSRRVVFRPDQPFARSTEFKVRVDAQTRSLDRVGLAEGPDWRFQTARVEIASVSPGERERQMMPDTPQLTLSLSQPVLAADVVAACLFTPASGGAAVKARRVDAEDSGPVRSVALAPERALTRGTKHRLECDASLHGAEGPLGMVKPWSAELRTYGDLSIESTRPGTGAGAVNADDLDIEIVFSNPVSLNEVTRHLSAKPPIPGLKGGSLDEQRKYSVRVSLEPGAEHEITIRAGLRDQFGQKLAADRGIHFQVGDAKPHLSMQPGTFLIERANPTYTIWTRNLGHVDVDAARVPPEKILAVARREPGGDERTYHERAEKKASPAQRWRRLGLKVSHRRLKLSTAKNKWQRGALSPADLAGGGEVGGVFALAAVAEEEEHSGSLSALVNVTNLGLVAKVGGASGLVWATHLDDGKPAAGVKIEVRDEQNKLRFSGVTGADGTLATPGSEVLAPPVAAAPRPEEEFEEERSPSRALFVFAREGDDLAFLSGDWNDGMSAWNFKLAYAPAPQRVRGFIHSDRGLYRPGETVHLKGLVRQVHLTEGLRLPAEKQIEITIADARGDEVAKRTLPISPFGSFALDVPISAEGRLGDWTVRASVGKAGQAVTLSDRFSVEEYRPATFEVTLKPGRSSYQIGQRVRADVDARFLYGAPLAGGKVTFKVRRRDHVPTFAAFEGFTFTDLNALRDVGMYWMGDEERTYSHDVTEEEGELDRKGHATFRFSTKDPASELKTAQDYLIEAEVADPSKQVRSARAAVVAHRSPFYLGVRTQEWMPQVGKPFVVDAVAVDESGKPRATQAQLVVSLHEWKCGRGDQPYYSCTEENHELERRAIALGAAPTPVRLTPPRAGDLRVSLRAPDGHGHEVVASTEVWAIGAGEVSWRQSDDVSFPLVASQSRFRPGDTARLVAQTPLAGATALITVERNGILTHEVRQLKSSGEAFSIPITRKHAPNVFASVIVIRPRAGEGDKDGPVMRMGVINLPVDASDKKLSVQVKTDKPSYRPGETVHARVSVRASSGGGVASEVAIAAADEGVLQLIGYKTPDPQAAFYAAFGIGVNTSANLVRLFRPRDPNGEDAGEGGDAGNASGKPRSKFLSTAFWAPQVVTDAEGNAEVSFAAPDNLTAFRIMAVAADAGDRFGSGEMRFTVAKPLVTLSALPRFLTVGDEAQAGVVVQNNSGQDGTVSVKVSAEGVSLVGPHGKDLAVPAGASKPALFGLKAQREGDARLTFTASIGDEKDALEVHVPIRRPVEQDVTIVGEGRTEGDSTELAVPAATGEGGVLDLVVDPVGLAGIDEGLRYLIEYPYGCLEQTTSRVVPLVAVGELAGTLGIEGLRGEKLRGYVEAGLAKILRHQHEDGAFSLWPGSRPEPFLTAYALWGLDLARRAHYRVDEKRIAQGIKALRAGLREHDMGHSDNPLGEAGARAFALYVLATLGKPDAGDAAALFTARGQLPWFGKAFLLRALVRGKGDSQAIATLVEELAAQGTAAPRGGKVIREGNAERLWYYFSSDARTSAVALSALLEAAPKHVLIPELARGLLASRSSGRWDNTQDNLFSLVALSEYARAASVKGSKQRVVATLGKRKIMDARFGAKTRVLRASVKLAGAGALTIRSEVGSVFYAARVRATRPLDKAEALAAGFSLERRFVDPMTETERTTLATGDVVRVVLRVSASADSTHVALVDHLPAGLEPINPRLEERAEAERGVDRDPWDRPWVAMELHDDRVAVFAEHLSRPRELSYLARATTAGRFVMPGATVEEMYRPEHRGRTAAKVIEIR